MLRSRAIRSPKVATLAAKSSRPCCCTSEGSDVIRVFIRDVKQASRLRGEGSRGWGRQRVSRLHQAPWETWHLGFLALPGQDLAGLLGAGEVLTSDFQPCHLGWSDAKWLERTDMRDTGGSATQTLRGTGFVCSEALLTLRLREAYGHRETKLKLRTGARQLPVLSRISSQPLPSPSLDQPWSGDHQVEEDVATGL